MLEERKRLVKKGDIYRSFIDGKERVVETVGSSTGEVTFDDGLVIKNMSAFEFFGCIEQNIQLSKEDVVVLEGKLLINDEEIEVGTLYVEKMLSVKFKNRVLLLVKSLIENKHDIFEYRLDQDRFNKIVEGISGVKEVCLEDDGGEEKFVEVEWEENSLFIYSEDSDFGNTESVFIEKPLGELKETRVDEGYTIMVFVSDKDIEIQHDVYDECYWTTNDKSNVVTEVVLTKRIESIYGKDEDDEEDKYVYKDYDINSFVIEDLEDAKITYLNNSLLLITKDGICFTNNGFSPRYAKGQDVLDVVKDYPYIVRLEPGKVHNEFVFANESGEVATVKVTKTSDRGYVTEIEK